MKRKNLPIALPDVDSVIVEVRGQKVILDSDLASIYGVATKRLNEQVKRNVRRFPGDFLFRLTRQEAQQCYLLRSRIATLKTGSAIEQPNRSQIATGSQKHRDPRLLPYAFTEHGAIMAANVLNSPQAARMSVFVVRAFVKLRECVATNATILKRLADIDKSLVLHGVALREIHPNGAFSLRIPPSIHSSSYPSIHSLPATT